MKPVPRRIVVEWVLKALEDLSSEMIKASMNLSVDGSQDHPISSFKEGEKTEEGAAQLKNQTLLLQNDEIDANPFQITDDDIADAAPLCYIVEDEYSTGDDEFDVDIFIIVRDRVLTFVL